MRIHGADEIFNEARGLVERSIPVRVETDGGTWYGPLKGPFDHLYVVIYTRPPSMPPSKGMVVPLEADERGFWYIVPLSPNESI